MFESHKMFPEGRENVENVTILVRIDSYLGKK
jgi:hypothetical protein